jgi:predicted alpha/beta-hydrolase family hydrolase
LKFMKTPFLFLLAAVLCSVPAWADEFISMPTREGVTSGYWWMQRENAKMNLLLLSGGSGGIGLRDGAPQSNNFLIRSRDYFAQQGYHVALLGNASDMRQLDPAKRVSAEHVQDISAVIRHIKARNGLPVWLVGTSQGTISAAAAAIALGAEVDGVVLTAPYTAYKTPTSVPRQKIDGITQPVLVMSHANDSCKVTLPHEAGNIIDGLKQARVKKLLIVQGGSDPRGDVCEALHWHGFIGMEAQAVKTITDWISAPAP